MVVFESIGGMLESISALGRIEGKRFVANGTRPDGGLVDRLAHTAVFGSSPASVTAVGSPLATSCAKVGPDSTAIGELEHTCRATS